MRLIIFPCCGLLSLLLSSCAFQNASRAIPSTPSTVSPGRSLGSATLQRDTLSHILFTDVISTNAAHEKCQDRTLIKMEVLERPQNVRMDGRKLVQGHWTERWTLNRCGKLVAYRVTYLAEEKTGISYDVKLDQ